MAAPREASTNTIIDHNNASDGAARHATKWLHPRVYAVLIGLALWFVLWVWSFVGAGITDYLLFIVSGFIFVVVALQLILSGVGQETTNLGTAEAIDKPASFRDWMRGDFDTGDGRMSGAEAAILILLPIAAAAIGMMAFGIEFQVVERAGA